MTSLVDNIKNLKHKIAYERERIAKSLANIECYEAKLAELQDIIKPIKSVGQGIVDDNDYIKEISDVLIDRYRPTPDVGCFNYLYVFSCVINDEPIIKFGVTNDLRGRMTRHIKERGDIVLLDTLYVHSAAKIEEDRLLDFIKEHGYTPRYGREWFVMSIDVAEDIFAKFRLLYNKNARTTEDIEQPQETVVNELHVFEIPKCHEPVSQDQINVLSEMFPCQEIVSDITCGAASAILTTQSNEQNVLEVLKTIWPNILSKKMTMIHEIAVLENNKTLILENGYSKKPYLSKHNNSYILMNAPIRQFLDYVVNKTYNSINYFADTYDQ